MPPIVETLKPLYPLLAGSLAFFGVFLAIAGLAGRSRRDPVDLRLEQVTSRARSLEEIEMSAPFSERFLKPMTAAISRMVARVTPNNVLSGTQKRLLIAGMAGTMQVSDFLGLKGLTTIIGIALALGFTILSHQTTAITVLAALVVGLAGYYFPDLWLRGRISKRKIQLTNELPDVIDLLTISVEAGLGFDQALGRIVSKSGTGLSLEFGRVLQEMQFGIPRREALRALVARTGVDDLSTFVSAIIQAEQLGASIGKVLRIQSVEMRVRRRQRAEKMAATAPVKILFPMAFLIFPPIFIVVLGPAIPRIVHAFAPGVQL